MTRHDAVKRIASGLRNMKNQPDAFLFCDEDELWTWDEPTILNIPVYHTIFVRNTMTDDNHRFIPIWKNEGARIRDRGLFNAGLEYDP